MTTTSVHGERGKKMAREIIVEFPSPLTDKEKKMIYGYKGEVVRCKDCRFFHRYGFKLEYAECVNFDFYDTTEDGYCCWAERREDG